MAIDPAYFIWCNEHGVRKGSIVRYEDQDWLVQMVYYGQEETLKVVNTLTDEERHLYPAEGIDKNVVKVYG